MPTAVLMPALELAQETGKVIRWLKSPGDAVTKGEPIVEIETDKVTTEIEAPASGILRQVTAAEGDVVPVGQPIAVVFAHGEAGGVAAASVAATADAASGATAAAGSFSTARPSAASAVKASPLARRLAEQHGVDLAQIKTSSGRIDKADVLAYVESRNATAQASGPGLGTAVHQRADGNGAVRLVAASPKARRLAAERGLDVGALRGSGPDGAVLVSDVPTRSVDPHLAERRPEAAGLPTVWRIMAERMTASWTSAPHFYLVREVNVTRLVSWRERAKKQIARVTYTDLLVKLVAAALARHPRVNASWRDGAIALNTEINVGLAVAVDDGLIVPVLHRADTLGVAEIAARREDLVSRGQAGKLRPADIQGGGFTISNLGMYGVDAFNAIVNPPQAAILAVGRIADRVVAVNGQPAVQPTMMLTLSCDHRALDGARGAQFLGDLADLIEEPLALLA